VKIGRLGGYWKGGGWGEREDGVEGDEEMA